MSRRSARSGWEQVFAAKAPPPPRQHDLGETMITDERAAFAQNIVNKRQLKDEGKKRFARQLEFQIRSYGLPKPFGYTNSRGEYSHEFAYCKDVGDTGLEPRRFQADYAWPDPQYRLLVELNGGIWIQGAHGHPTGIERDIVKHQYAAILGWFVLPVTTDDVKSGLAIARLQQYFVSRGWRSSE